MDALLWTLMIIGAAVVVGSLFALRALPRDLRPFAIVPLGVVLAGFVVGFLVLAGVFG
ncbi:MAG: hypothetical protein Q4F65_01635 [Propionibacteriaceae bacterium]|nr:hypothetical protein [Propionibacteriaceae bacterium]